VTDKPEKHMSNLTPESVQEVIDKLQAMIAPKNQEPRNLSAVTRWIPVCDHYVSAQAAWIRTEKGGATISGKTGGERTVLFWLKVRIDPTASKPVEIIETVIL